MLAKLIFMAMPFIGVRLGIPMLSGGGNTTPPALTEGSLFPIIFG